MALASIALALSEGLREVKIASTYDWDHHFPWGSHPQLDPLWSNGKVVLTHDGCEATRLDKTHLVSRHPIALETFRVCFENPDSLHNCGKCKKCLKTMDELQRWGALERCGSFPQTAVDARDTPHPPFEHLLPGAEEGIRVALAGQPERVQANQSSPSAQRGEGRGEGRCACAIPVRGALEGVLP